MATTYSNLSSQQQQNYEDHLRNLGLDPAQMVSANAVPVALQFPSQTSVFAVQDLMVNQRLEVSGTMVCGTITIGAGGYLAVIGQLDLTTQALTILGPRTLPAIMVIGKDGAPGPDGSPFTLPAPSGNAGISGTSKRTPFFFSPPSCVAPPTGGMQGQSGADGARGVVGEPGEAGPNASINADTIDGDLIIRVGGGCGGDGGSGAAGQQGGSGGAAATAQGACPPSSAGNGGNGGNGGAGANGGPGGNGGTVVVTYQTRTAGSTLQSENPATPGGAGGNGGGGGQAGAPGTGGGGMYGTAGQAGQTGVAGPAGMQGTVTFRQTT